MGVGLLIVAVVAMVVIFSSQAESAMTSATTTGDNVDVGIITSNQNTWPTGDTIWDVCRAVAHAEGAHIAGSVPDRLNNPGDLSPGDEHGQPTLGSEYHDGSTVIHFVDKVGGWSALYQKFSNAYNGYSHVFNGDMSFATIGSIYAGSDAGHDNNNPGSWSIDVANYLGVTPQTTLAQYVEQNVG